MFNTEYTNAWIDRYLRNELTAEDEARFENALLESRQLQDDLESALAVRRVLRLEARSQEAKEDPAATGARFPWFTMALCASLILAVLSGVMYWNVSHEVANLRSDVEGLGEPHANALIVPLDIMRSAGQDLPEAIIHKPADGTFVTLDIELSETAVAANAIHLLFRDERGAELAAWHHGAIENGRVRASFDAKHLPEGRVWLEVTDTNDRVLDRRLLEFR